MCHYLYENDNIVVQFPGKLSVNLLYGEDQNKFKRGKIPYFTLLPYYMRELLFGELRFYLLFKNI